MTRPHIGRARPKVSFCPLKKGDHTGVSALSAPAAAQNAASLKGDKCRNSRGGRDARAPKHSQLLLEWARTLKRSSTTSAYFRRCSTK